MRVLMLVISPVATDTRVLREAATLADAGHTVHIIGRNVPPDFTPPPGVTVSTVGAGSALRREGAPSLGAQRRLPPHIRTARWLLLPEHRNSAFAAWRRRAAEDARTRPADVVHAHDFNTLELGAALAAERGIPLVYDTHELWSGRPRVGRPTPAQHRSELRRERDWGRQATTVITVGDGVAERLRALHGWHHVRVVRNTFPLGADPVASATTGADPDARPAAPAATDLPDQPTGLVYAGRIAPFRELETIAAAAPRLHPLRVTIVGPADDTYLATFDPHGADVLPARPVPEVDVLLRQAGLALVTHSDRWENHRLALPNKLFHAIRAGVPVIATDVPELRRIVTAHDLGALYTHGDPDSLVAAVADARRRYPELRRAVRAAAPALSWEHDARVLLDVYANLAADTAEPDTGAADVADGGVSEHGVARSGGDPR